MTRMVMKFRMKSRFVTTPSNPKGWSKICSSLFFWILAIFVTFLHIPKIFMKLISKIDSNF